MFKDKYPNYDADEMKPVLTSQLGIRFLYVSLDEILWKRISHETAKEVIKEGEEVLVRSSGGYCTYPSGVQSWPELSWAMYKDGKRYASSASWEHWGYFLDENKYCYCHNDLPVPSYYEWADMKEAEEIARLEEIISKGYVRLWIENHPSYEGSCQVNVFTSTKPSLTMKDADLVVYIHRVQEFGFVVPGFFKSTYMEMPRDEFVSRLYSAIISDCLGAYGRLSLEEVVTYVKEDTLGNAVLKMLFPYAGTGLEKWDYKHLPAVIEAAKNVVAKKGSITTLRKALKSLDPPSIKY